VLAGEFRQLNLQDAWKEDVLQLHAQLYYAFMSLQRPLEVNRSGFQMSQTVIGRSKAESSDDVEVRGRKRKHREDSEGDLNPKRRFKCVYCNNEKRSFFDHGFRGHL
jgi:hypothetical protein